MKSKYLFVIAAVLLVGGIAILLQGFHGTIGFTGSAPIANSGLEVSGSTHGGWALGGVATLLLSIAAFVFAVVRAFIFETEK